MPPKLEVRGPDREFLVDKVSLELPAQYVLTFILMMHLVCFLDRFAQSGLPELSLCGRGSLSESGPGCLLPPGLWWVHSLQVTATLSLTATLPFSRRFDPKRRTTSAGF